MRVRSVHVSPARAPNALTVGFTTEPDALPRSPFGTCVVLRARLELTSRVYEHTATNTSIALNASPRRRRGGAIPARNRASPSRWKRYGQRRDDHRLSTSVRVADSSCIAVLLILTTAGALFARHVESVLLTGESPVVSAVCERRRFLFY